jgi:hypothetical protein
MRELDRASDAQRHVGRRAHADRSTSVVPAKVAIAAFSGVGHVDYKRFRADVDRFVDQDPRRALGMSSPPALE